MSLLFFYLSDMSYKFVKALYKIARIVKMKRGKESILISFFNYLTESHLSNANRQIQINEY